MEVVAQSSFASYLARDFDMGDRVADIDSYFGREEEIWESDKIGIELEGGFGVARPKRHKLEISVSKLSYLVGHWVCLVRQRQFTLIDSFPNQAMQMRRKS